MSKYSVLAPISDLVFRLIRRIPYFKGKGRLALIMAKMVPPARHQSVKVRMTLGHTMFVCPTSNTERMAYLTGDYDPISLSAIMRLASPGDIVLDVGANIGFYSIPLAKKVSLGDGRLFCFEPVPENVLRLIQNIEVNNLARFVKVFPIALSNHRGTGELSLREDFEQGSRTGNAALVVEDGDDDQFQRITVSLGTLDEIAADLSLQRCDLIKADIEGHEDLFLEGAKDTIHRFRPIIVAEMNPYFMGRRGIVPSAFIDHFIHLHDYSVLKQNENRRWTSSQVASERGVFLEDIYLVPRERAAMAVMKLTAEEPHLLRREYTH